MKTPNTLKLLEREGVKCYETAEALYRVWAKAEEMTGDGDITVSDVESAVDAMKQFAVDEAISDFMHDLDAAREMLNDIRDVLHQLSWLVANKRPIFVKESLREIEIIRKKHIPKLFSAT